ncbi:DUF5624 domain-containing protein [Jatrophihabitans telluris]|uniref:DUF5624 domain-containing protein n=1 Tax=Jatrophihabitans telluris TaxID=2038343 RepID=A0ABY4QTX6_9ACTN|nr:DUF5624 domain-containing protein [Jatrophihabitans telluris]UQX86950.1 DUF5624 domain-containing protein [Jatrophihabitans telluris]
MPPFDSPELLDLFTTYTAGPASIGAHFAQVAMRSCADQPLIVATGTDIAFFAGSGSSPVIQPFRLSTRGFKELAAVSHLGPALATLSVMAQQDPDGSWRADAARLLDACKAARAANSIELWRDHIRVTAFRGREAAIASMVDYSCRVTEHRLSQALDRPAAFTMHAVREEYLEGPAQDLPVPFSRIMIATFFLTGLDLAHRLISWFDGLDLDWERAMVIVAGRAGRATAGVTEESNSVAGVIRTAARNRLRPAHLYIAPHAPVFPAYDGTNGSAVAGFEDGYRALWASLDATSKLGADMFAGYPEFAPRSGERTPLGAGSRSVAEKPAIADATDWRAMTTRLRVVMEDSRQLLSGAVTDYASQQLIDSGNDPAAVTVPGLDGEPFPPINEESGND